MAETQYRYNPETCSYEPLATRWYVRLYRSVPWLLLTLGVALGAAVLFYGWYDSPRTRLLRSDLNQWNRYHVLLVARADSMQTVLDSLRARNRLLYRSIFNADPAPLTDTQRTLAVVDTSQSLESLDALQQRVDHLSSKLENQLQSNQLLVELARLKKRELAFVPSIRPVKSEIISGYGMRLHPVFKKDVFHAGLDFQADIGTPIVATADGWVVEPQTVNKTLGTVVRLDHRNGYQTFYAHLSKALVRPGQRVKRGQVIGHSGNSGLTKGPHVYYEIQRLGRPVDPIDYLFNDLQPEQMEPLRKVASAYNESMS